MKSLLIDEFGAVIRYHEVAGDGPTIVYLAAVAFPSLPTFLPVATDPSLRSHHALFVDYFGVGHSEHPTDFDHSLLNHAKTVACVLDHEGLRDCIVVGHSMGGTVGIYLAIQRPELVSHLVVCEGNIATGGGVGTRYFTSVSEGEFVSTFFPQFLARSREAGKDGDDYAYWRGGAWDNADYAGIYRQCAALVNLDPEFKQAFLSLPTKRTFVYGEEDLPEKTGEIKADAPDPDELKAHGVSVAVVPGVGHSMMIPNPSGFAEVLDAAL